MCTREECCTEIQQLSTMGKGVEKRERTYSNKKCPVNVLLIFSVCKLFCRIDIMTMLQEHGHPNLGNDYDDEIKDALKKYEKRWAHIFLSLTNLHMVT